MLRLKMVRIRKKIFGLTGGFSDKFSEGNVIPGERMGLFSFVK